MDIVLSCKSSDPYFVGLYEAMVHFVSIDIEKKDLHLRLENAIDQRDFTTKLVKLLRVVTGDDWDVILEQNVAGEPSILEKKRIEQRKIFEGIKLDPLVVAILENFPDSEIIEVN